MKQLVKSIVILSIWYPALQAQEAIPASGGNASGSGGSASYSVGQVVYTSQTSSSGSVSEGVQQAFVIEVISALNNAQNINLSVSAYPNPTTDNLTLSINTFEFSVLQYQLYDVNGKLLLSSKTSENETSIPMNKLASATYILKVVSNNQTIKEFKIIKK